MFKFLKKAKEDKTLNIARHKDGERYSDCYGVYPRTGKVKDEDIANYVKKHTHWWDRFDLHFVSDCVLEATDILTGYVEPPKGRWFFGDRAEYGRWIEEDEWIETHKDDYPHKDFHGDGASVRYR